jgi:hypothetical protein
MKTKHPIHDSNLPKTFEEIAHNVKHPEIHVPNSGYVEQARASTERGRAKIAADAAARRGIASFPPARLLNKGGRK